MNLLDSKPKRQKLKPRHKMDYSNSSVSAVLEYVVRIRLVQTIKSWPVFD